MKGGETMKTKRFVIEYANYKIDKIFESKTLTDTEKTDTIKRIDKAVNYCKTGYITIEETMKAISEI